METVHKKKAEENASAIIKIGASRQVAIPKKVYDALELTSGDYLELTVKDNNIVLTPKVFIEKRLAEGLADIKKGKTSRTFSRAEDAIKSLRK